MPVVVSQGLIGKQVGRVFTSVHGQTNALRVVGLDLSSKSMAFFSQKHTRQVDWRALAYGGWYAEDRPAVRLVAVSCEPSCRLTEHTTRFPWQT